MRSNKVVLGALTAGAVFALAACSGVPGGDSRPASSGQADEGDVTLQVMGVERTFTADAIAAFEDQNPSITVEFINQQPVFEDGSVQTMLRSGTGADVLDISTGPARVGELIKAGLLPQIDDVWESEDLEENMIPYAVEQIDAWSDGHKYEVPNGVDVFQVAYNKKIFDDLGLSVPETWDEFEDVLEMSKVAGIQPIVAGFRDGLGAGWMFGQVLQAVAGKPVVADVLYGGGAWDQKPMVAAAGVMKDWFDQGYMDGGTVSALGADQAQAAFYEGGGALSFLGNTHLIRAFSQGLADEDTFGLFPLPSPNQGQEPAATAGMGTSWVMNSGTDTPQAAKAWLAFVASDEFVRIAVESGDQNSVPARVLPEGLELPALLANAAEQVDTAGYNPSVFVDAKTKDAWYGAGQLLATGGNPADAMASIQAAASAQ